MALNLLTISDIKNNVHHKVTMQDFLFMIATLLALACGIALFSWLYIILPTRMAKARGRNPVGWVFVFLFISPLWGAILLSIVGDSSQKIREDIINEIRGNQ